MSVSWEKVIHIKYNKAKTNARKDVSTRGVCGP